MDIIFYKSTNEVNSFPKTLTDGVTISGSLRSECDVLNPVIEFTGIGVDIPYNYCYIPTFKRYYFVTEAISIRTNILQLSFHVDVLQSWANELLNTRAMIYRSEDVSKQNKYIEDEKYITYPECDFIVKEATSLSGSLEETDVQSNNSYSYVIITSGVI